MHNVVNATHVTRNENGYEQIEFEIRVPFWRRMFAREPFTLTFELLPIGWRNKVTGEPATLDERFTITGWVAQAKSECGQ